MYFVGPGVLQVLSAPECTLLHFLHLKFNHAGTAQGAFTARRVSSLPHRQIPLPGLWANGYTQHSHAACLGLPNACQ